MLGDADNLGTIHLITFVIGVGIGVQWLAVRLRIPALFLLLVSGVLLGPVFGILSQDRTGQDAIGPFISIAVAIVLFEGGLSLRFDEAQVAGRALWRLIVTGLVGTSVLVAFVAIKVAGLSVATAAVLGAILVVTGPTVVLPMLRAAKISLRPASLLKWEGIVNDPLGALLAVFVLQIALTQVEQSSGLLAVFSVTALQAIASAVVGGTLGFVFGRALRSHQIPEFLESPVILTGALVAFAIGEALGQENGLLAVTVMGLVLANLKDANLVSIRHFKEQVSVLLVSILFIVLSARLDMASMEALIGPPLLVVLAVVFVVRPIVVGAATIGSGLPWSERALIGWIAPRGVVAAAVAGEFEPRLVDAGYADANLLVPIVFGVIILTVVVQGLTIAPLSRRLGLGGAEGNGILIVGIKEWTADLAKALQMAGAFVVLADTHYHRVSHARRRRIDVYYGDVLSDEAVLSIPFERISWLLALTDDDAYNSLVCVNFARELGKDKVLQLTPQTRQTRRNDQHSFMGKTPWGETGDYMSLARGYWNAGGFRVATIDDEVDLNSLLRLHTDGMFLFCVVEGRVEPINAKTNPPLGAKIVFLPGTAASNKPGRASESSARSPIPHPSR